MSDTSTKVVFNPFTFICAIMTAIIGHTINDGSIFWAVIDFFFWPFAIIKWLICHEICLTVIKESFSFFMK